jgi:putative SOS response-associated peptidase YedK
MCGRFTLRARPEAIAEEFELPDFPTVVEQAHFNIAPTQQVAAIRLDPEKGSRTLSLLKWGLVPSWAEDPAIGNRMINARADSAATKPSFRHAFKAKRCLIVADGFYEWQKLEGRKQPYFIHLKTDRPFAFAGLWERWDKGGEPLESCTILTTDANSLMTPIHDRMPVVVPKAAYGLWLDPTVHEVDKLQEILRPFPPEEMEAYPVSTLVNKPSNDVEGCIRRAVSEKPANPSMFD